MRTTVINFLLNQHYFVLWGMGAIGMAIGSISPYFWGSLIGFIIGYSFSLMFFAKIIIEFIGKTIRSGVLEVLSSLSDTFEKRTEDKEEINNN